MKRTIAATVAGITLAGAVGLGVASASTGSGPGGRLGKALAGLVSNGTLTQNQADAVGKALDDAHASEHKLRESERTERMAQIDTLLSDTLGLTRTQIRKRIQDGETLLQIAGDKSDELAAGALELVKKDLTQDVTDGRLTQAQADKILDRAKEGTQDWLDGKDSGRGLGMLLGGGGGRDGRGGPGHRGHGPGNWDGPDGRPDA